MSWQDKLGDSLQDQPVVKINEEKTLSIMESIYRLDRSMLRRQLEKNEKQKRKYRAILLTFVVCFILVQTIVINCFTWHLLINEECFTGFALEKFLGFIKFFVGATVVEVLGMLRYIIHNCFDNTISKHFGEEKTQEKE